GRCRGAPDHRARELEELRLRERAPEPGAAVAVEHRLDAGYDLSEERRRILLPRSLREARAVDADDVEQRTDELGAEVAAERRRRALERLRDGGDQVARDGIARIRSRPREETGPLRRDAERRLVDREPAGLGEELVEP